MLAVKQEAKKCTDYLAEGGKYLRFPELRHQF